MLQIISLLSLTFLILITSACTKKEDEEVDFDYESMVMAEDEEWTVERHKNVAGELGPDAQEVLIVEEPASTR